MFENLSSTPLKAMQAESSELALRREILSTEFFLNMKSLVWSLLFNEISQLNTMGLTALYWIKSSSPLTVDFRRIAQLGVGD